MGAGLDTVTLPESNLPIGYPVGVVARITFSTRDAVGEEHVLVVVFRRDADQLLIVRQVFQTPSPQPGVPEYWRTGLNIALRAMLPIPRLGNYQLEVTLDEDPTKSRTLDFRAIAPAAQS